MKPFSCESKDPETLAFLKHTSKACREALYAWTMPLYGVNEKEDASQIGSGTLLEIGNKHFLITAAHVFDVFKQDGLSPFVTSGIVGEQLVPLNNVLRRSSETRVPVKRSDDPFDICVCELTDEIVGMINRGKRFARLDQIDPLDGTHPQSWYMVFGYPSVVNPSDQSAKKIFGNACAFASFIYYNERGTVGNFDKEVQMLLDCSANTTFNDAGNQESILELYGMSGGGVWRLAEAGCSMTEWKSGDVRLVGVQHSRFGFREVLQATRIRYALQLIYRNHKELHPEMESHFGEHAKRL